MLGFDLIGVVTTFDLARLFVCYEDGLQYFAPSVVFFVSVLKLEEIVWISYMHSCK